MTQNMKWNAILRTLGVRCFYGLWKHHQSLRFKLSCTKIKQAKISKCFMNIESTYISYPQKLKSISIQQDNQWIFGYIPATKWNLWLFAHNSILIKCYKMSNKMNALSTYTILFCKWIKFCCATYYVDDTTMRLLFPNIICRHRFF